MGTDGLRLHSLDPSVPMVAALLDVCNSDCSVRGAVRWSGFLPSHLSAAGTARDHRKTDGERIPVGGRRAFGSPQYGSDYLPYWLPSGPPLKLRLLQLFRLE